MDQRDFPNPPRASWRDKWHDIIFGRETFAGRFFDSVLLIVILLSVLVVLLESVPSAREKYGAPLRIGIWVFTGLFTLEYLARLVTATSAKRYARSFLGIVDFLAIGPVYLGFFLGAARSFSVLRSLRLLRIFQILKLTQFVGEAAAIRVALIASLRKITVFLSVVLIIVIIVGALMYEIEGDQNGFTSIPAGMYWAVVTITTVGYGDISPHTVGGRFLACILMIIGYGIIAVPTGIVSYELGRGGPQPTSICQRCRLRYQDREANYCKRCGAPLR